MFAVWTSPVKNGATAMIVSGDGTHDVFVIGATIAAARWLTPNHTLSRAYPVGSVVIEVEQDTFRLADQPNGSRSLIRETAAGAVQPIVDFVTDLSFDVQGEDVDRHHLGERAGWQPHPGALRAGHRGGLRSGRRTSLDPGRAARRSVHRLTRFAGLRQRPGHAATPLS